MEEGMVAQSPGCLGPSLQYLWPPVPTVAPEVSEAVSSLKTSTLWDTDR